MMIKKTCNILCIKKNVYANFLKCFPKDDEPPFFENCLKRGMQACAIRKKSYILVSIGLGSKLELLTPIGFNLWKNDLIRMQKQLLEPEAFGSPSKPPWQWPWKNEIYPHFEDGKKSLATN